MKCFLNLLFLWCLGIPPALMAQQQDSIPSKLDLPQLVGFALEHSPLVRQSELDQQIGER